MGDAGSKGAILQLREHQLKILSRANQQINAQLEIKSILRHLVEAALELTGAGDGAVGLCLDGMMVFKEYYRHGRWMPIDYSFPPGYGVPGWVLDHQEPYISNDTENDPHVIQEIRKSLGFYNLIDIPIFNRNDELIGCFEIHNTERGRPFDEQDIILLQGLSASAAIAMENARIIEDLKSTELQLRESKTYFWSLFEESPVSLWEEDFSAVKALLDGLKKQGIDNLEDYLNDHPEIVAQCAVLARITNVNKVTLDLFEAADKKDLLENLDQIMTEESLQTFGKELVSMAAGDKQGEVTGINKTLGGKEIEVSVKWSILPGYEENWEKVVISMVDVTRDREIDRMKNEFISTAAHELRTPLSVLMGYAELLLTEEAKLFSTEEKEEFLTYIYSKGLSLERIIDDLLDVGRIETGRTLVLDKSVVQFAPLLEELCGNHQRETQKHSISLDCSKEDGFIAVDKERLTQVLDNLLSNAVKYSPDGGVIRVKGEREPGSYMVSVSDNGIGMTEQQKSRVFDKFYRADTSNTALRGLGLGMCIAKSIIEAHGGEIWVESVPQQGSTVSFTLPLSEADHGRLSDV